jgi:hypothetical protein
MNWLTIVPDVPLEAPGAQRRLTDDVVFSPSRGVVIDFLCTDGRTHCRSLAVEELLPEHPDAVVIDWREASRRIEDRMRTPPVRTTDVEWRAALSVLPPADWRREGRSESFKMSERITGRLTHIYCRIEDRYFSFADDIALTHREIVARCEALP